MKNRVTRVFKALSKKGMSSAYVVVDNKEFVYPRIRSGWKYKRAALLAGTLCLILSVGALILFQPVDDRKAVKISARSEPEGYLLDNTGLTDLHKAVIRTDFSRIEELIQSEKNLNQQDHYGWTPLHWAIFCENAKICRYLIKHGALPNISSKKGWFKFPRGTTPEQLAKISNSAIILALFKSANQN